MKLTDVVKKIMGDKDLKSKLKGLGSLDEVYEFFKLNGYEGDKEEFLREFMPLRLLMDDDLDSISGGISGRQVLSACMGLMMLPGSMPSVFGVGSRAETKSIGSSSNIVSRIKSLKNKLDQKILRIDNKLGLKTGGQIKNEKLTEQDQKLLRYVDICSSRYAFSYYAARAGILYDENNLRKNDEVNASTISLRNKADAFVQVEHYKYFADLVNLEYNTDVTEYKAQLDSWFAENDFVNTSEKDYEKEFEAIVNSHQEIISKGLGLDSKYKNVFKESLRDNLTYDEKLGVLRYFKEKLDAVAERFSGLFANEQENNLNKFITADLFAKDFLGLDIENNVHEWIGFKKVMGMGFKEGKEMYNYLKKYK